MGTIRGNELFDSFRQLGVRPPCKCAWVAALVILLWMLTGASAAAQPNAKNVLIMFSFFDRDYDALNLLESTVRAHASDQVNFNTDYLQNPRFEEESYQQTLAETIRQGYGATKLDLVITEGPEALQFATRYRDRMFQGVPIVFVGVAPDQLGERRTWPGVTGVTDLVGLKPTIDLALRLHPDTTAVAVITGLSKWERYWLAAAHSELLRYQDNVREIDVVGRATTCRVHSLMQMLFGAPEYYQLVANPIMYCAFLSMLL